MKQHIKRFVVKQIGGKPEEKEIKDIRQKIVTL
jgi:hypothetical protein